MGRPHRRGGRPARGRRPVRDGPGPLPRAAAARSAPRCRSSTVGPCRTPPARCSIRSSACGAGSALAPGECARLIFSTLVAPSRETAVALADKYRDPATFERTVDPGLDPGAGAAPPPRHRSARGPPLPAIWRAASCTPIRRCAPRRTCCDANTAGAVGPLGATGISGDLPIVLVRIDEPEDRGIVRQLLRAHEYWRMKGLAVDLVILNEKAHSYVQELQTALEALVRTSQSAPAARAHETHGRRLRAPRRTCSRPTDHAALQSAARAVLLSRHGTLAEQVARAESAPGRRGPSRAAAGPGRGGRARAAPAASSSSSSTASGGFVRRRAAST